MPLPQHIHYGVGGTISIELDHRPANCVVDIEDDGGSNQDCAGATATVSSISNVINVAATRGDRQISVCCNAGMSAGETFRFADDSEQVLIRKVDDCNIHLKRPLIHDHINATTVEGTKVSFAVNSQIANSLWWEGRAVWNINSGAAYYYSAVECTRYPTRMLCGTQILFDLEPQAAELLDEEVDVERLKNMAIEYVLGRLAAIAPDTRARVMPGDREFEYAVGLTAWMMHYRRQRGDDAAELYQRYRDALDSELGRVATTTPRDADQDTSIEIDEKLSTRSVRLIR